MRERKSYEARSRVLELERKLGRTELKQARSAPRLELQRQLNLRRDPQYLRSHQPQIPLPQREPLLRRFSGLNHRPTQAEGRRPVRKPDLRPDPGVSCQTPPPLRPLPARQPSDWRNPCIEPDESQILQCLKQQAFRRDSSDSGAHPVQFIFFLEQSESLWFSDSESL